MNTEPIGNWRLPRRIFLHLVFWVGYTFVWILMFANWTDPDKAFWMGVVNVVPQIIIAYVNMEVLMPKYFIQKKYVAYFLFIVLCFRAGVFCLQLPAYGLFPFQFRRQPGSPWRWPKSTWAPTPFLEPLSFQVDIPFYPDRCHLFSFYCLQNVPIRQDARKGSHGFEKRKPSLGTQISEIPDQPALFVQCPEQHLYTGHHQIGQHTRHDPQAFGHAAVYHLRLQRGKGAIVQGDQLYQKLHRPAKTERRKHGEHQRGNGQCERKPSDCPNAAHSIHRKQL